MNAYEVKWKGRRSGPFSFDELWAKYQAREIGAMHEVSVDGQWMTVRSFFRRNPPAPKSSTDRTSPRSQAPSSGDAAPPPPPLHGESLRSEPPHPPSPAPDLAAGASGAMDPAGPAETTLPLGSLQPDETVDRYRAGFWVRAMAIALDGILIFWAPLWIYDYFFEATILTVETARTLTPIHWTLGGLGAAIVGWLYFTLLEGSALRASLGKRCVGLTVRRRDGSPMDLATSSLRNLAKVGSALMLGTGFLLAIFTPGKQTFHDMLSGTVVSLNLSRSQRLSMIE